MSDKIDVFALRTIRKTSHTIGKVTHKSSVFLGKVENKTTKLIVNKTGSYGSSNAVSLSDFSFKEFPYLEPIYPVLPKLGQKPSITVLAFLDPKGFYGGIATLIIVSALLAKELDYDLRVVQTTGYSKTNDVTSFLKSKGIDFPASRFSTIDLSFRHPSNFGYLPMHPKDVFMVSAWWDAYVTSLLPLSQKFVYLIQDYEPIFYNNGDSKIFADQTYFSEKFIPLCNTELIYDFFSKNGYDYIRKNGQWFEPAPVPAINNAPQKAIKAKKRLFLYGRPQVHRNLFLIALNAIEEAFKSNELDPNDWELFCAGQSDFPSIRLSTGQVIKNLGKMDINKYYKFASTIDVAVSPMLAPHPNYPTLELASLGAAVVSTKYENKQDLSRYSPNILMAEANPQDMTKKIIEACKMDKTERLANLKHNHIGDNWSENLKKPISELAKTLLA
jgi:hypothetical protein